MVAPLKWCNSASLWKSDVQTTEQGAGYNQKREYPQPLGLEYPKRKRKRRRDLEPRLQICQPYTISLYFQTNHYCNPKREVFQFERRGGEPPLKNYRRTCSGLGSMNNFVLILSTHSFAPTRIMKIPTHAVNKFSKLKSSKSIKTSVATAKLAPMATTIMSMIQPMTLKNRTYFDTTHLFPLLGMVQSYQIIGDFTTSGDTLLRYLC